MAIPPSLGLNGSPEQSSPHRHSLILPSQQGGDVWYFPLLDAAATYSVEFPFLHSGNLFNSLAEHSIIILLWKEVAIFVSGLLGPEQDLDDNADTIKWRCQINTFAVP